MGIYTHSRVIGLKSPYTKALRKLTQAKNYSRLGHSLSAF